MDRGERFPSVHLTRESTMIRVIHPTDSMLFSVEKHREAERRIRELREIRAALVLRSAPWYVRAWHAINCWLAD